MSNRSWIGFAAAATLGVVIGILVAPEKGSKSLTKIKRAINDWASDLLNEIEAGQNKVEDYTEDARDKAFELKGKAETKLSSLKDEAAAKADDLVDHIRDQYNEAKAR
ncbi:MAG: YtxH domain-containing protein [Siphonobacter sp.]